jgi:hypothetical protein
VLRAVPKVLRHAPIAARALPVIGRTRALQTLYGVYPPEDPGGRRGRFERVARWMAGGA